MDSPILIFTKKNKLGSLNLSKEGRLFWGKSLLRKEDEWNTNLEIIDSNGWLYKIEKIVSTGKLSLFHSIKSIGLMVEAKFTYASNDIVQLSLDELKDKCYSCVKNHKAFWSPINDGRGLKRMIYEAKDFKELILMFK